MPGTTNEFNRSKISKSLDLRENFDPRHRIPKPGQVTRLPEHVPKETKKKITINTKIDLTFLQPPTSKLELVAVFSRQLAILLNSGINIRRILTILEEQTTDHRFKKIVHNIGSDVLLGGTKLSKALAKYPEYFPSSYSGMVSAAEASGTLYKIASKLADNYEKEVALVKRTISVLIYPAVIVFFAVCSVVFIIKFIIPSFLPVFTEMKADLPVPTKILIQITKDMGDPVKIIIFIVLIITLIFLLRLYYTTREGKYNIDKFTLKIPVVGNLLNKIALVKVSRMMNLFSESGITISTGLVYIKNAMTNELFKQDIQNILELIKQGKPISKAFSMTRKYPPLFVNMLATGEQSGKLSVILAKIVSIYDIEIEDTMNKAVTMIEPMLIIFLGISITFIMLACFLPLYSIIGKLN